VREGREAVRGALSRIASNLRHRTGLARSRMAGTAGRLEGLSPLSVLGRGYSITRALPAGTVVRRPADAPPGTQVEISLQRGSIRALVRSGKRGAPDPGKREKP
ncbi:MAG: exodeoxyribonuclease VII large subunit, partial [Myxococcota bacterium]